MDQLNVKEQQEFQQIVEQKQMKDFMNLYSNLVSRCFDDCVNDFTSANLTSKESSCISKCSEKFLKHSERVGQRFQEQKYVWRDNHFTNTNIQRYVDAEHAETLESIVYSQPDDDFECVEGQNRMNIAVKCRYGDDGVIQSQGVID